MRLVHEISHQHGVRTLHFDFDDQGQQVIAAVTTRVGGCSTEPYASLNLGYHVGDDERSVRENRARVCGALGVERLTVADQQHGPNVALIDEELDGAGHDSWADAQTRLGNVDAMVTDRVGTALMIMVADCAPVVLYDPEHRALGVAHVGRGGAVHDVIGNTVAKMHTEFGSEPDTLLAGIGPCIDAGGYELGDPQLTETRDVFGDELFRPSTPGHACFDLREAVRRRLQQAGVADHHMEFSELSTSTHQGLLFSDRAQRPCGRFGLIASLR